MTYQPGELLLVAFSDSGSSQRKNRPALVILDTGDADVVVARVMTQPYSTPFDVAIQDWPAAGLLAASCVRLHKLATLEKNRVYRRLGQLQPVEQQSVSAVMRTSYGAW